MSPKIIRIISMMAFLGQDDYLIPSHELPPHEDVKPYDYRISRTYRFFKGDRTMSYNGVEPGKSRITIHNLRLSKPYSDRLYDTLIVDCRKKMEKEQKTTHMKQLGKILSKFSGINFVLSNCGVGD